MSVESSSPVGYLSSKNFNLPHNSVGELSVEQKFDMIKVNVVQQNVKTFKIIMNETNKVESKIEKFP